MGMDSNGKMKATALTAARTAAAQASSTSSQTRTSTTLSTTKRHGRSTTRRSSSKRWQSSRPTKRLTDCLLVVPKQHFPEPFVAWAPIRTTLILKWATLLTVCCLGHGQHHDECLRSHWHG